MKKINMKRLKQCFGKKTMFYKKKIKECVHCQFKRKCLLKIKGRLEDD